MRKFEGQLTDDINGALGRYVSAKQYVLSVKVIWNRDVIPAVQAPGLAPKRQKLPGFPIFVNAPGAPAGDDSTPPYVRMVVKVLIDETLPEYYERFIRKIVPIVARFDTARGDQVVVLKETFPVREKDELPPTIPEKQLMAELGLPARPQPPGRAPAMAPGMGMPTPGMPGRRPAPQIPKGVGAIEAARLAYDEERYQDALQIVQSAFQRARSNLERSLYLGMEGSVFYTMDNSEGANASWQRAVTFDPTNMEVQRALNFFRKLSEAQQEPFKKSPESGGGTQ
jgi:tetratricopeptide (TPR) repeat protein